MDYGPATGAALREVQLERLRWTLRHAGTNSPHYARACDAAGVGPDDLRSPADLARFPFTTKADLRAAYPFGMFAVPRERVARLHASSDTTGRPTLVGYTREDIVTWASLVARSLHAAGVRAGMRVHVAYGYGLFTGGLGADYGAEARPGVDLATYPHEARALAGDIKEAIGVSVRADVVAPATLPRSAGKASRVIDRRR